jgi:hypothetical protein
MSIDLIKEKIKQEFKIDNNITLKKKISDNEYVNINNDKTLEKLKENEIIYFEIDN